LSRGVNPKAAVSVGQDKTVRQRVEADGADGRVMVSNQRGDASAPRTEPDQPTPTSRANQTVTDPDEDGVRPEPERQLAAHGQYRELTQRDYGTAPDQWAEAVPELRGSWEKIREKYHYEERDEPTPPPRDGSWHGQGGRRLDAAQNEEVDRGYAVIREVGRRAIIPGILSVEAEDITRCLAGLDKCFKGEDRLKEKVADLLEPSSELSAAEALGAVSDVVRFTCLYPESRYTQGVIADVERIKVRGFELDQLKNTWTSDQYKGINTQWLEPESGVRFEVQFHTHASLEAKELSHKAYERIRSITSPSPQTDQEAAELEGFQSSVNAMVPIPADVSVIEDYRREQRNG
jgi:hypothetical protein